MKLNSTGGRASTSTSLSSFPLDAAAHSTAAAASSSFFLLSIVVVVVHAAAVVSAAAVWTQPPVTIMMSLSFAAAKKAVTATAASSATVGRTGAFGAGGAAPRRGLTSGAVFVDRTAARFAGSAPTAAAFVASPRRRTPTTRADAIEPIQARRARHPELLLAQQLQYRQNRNSHRLLASPSSFSTTTSSSSASKNDSNDNDDNWTVPSYVKIPQDGIEIAAVRSSKSGGQNVNKVNTQIQLRVHVMTSSWIGPYEVRQRLMEQQRHRINKDGYLQVHVQDHRTQVQNKQLALERLEDMILEAWPRPAVRKQRKGLSRKTKQARKEFKRRRSQVKDSRRRIDDF